MRRSYPLLLLLMVAVAPAAFAAQVTVDPNALNALGPALLPEPPPGVPAHAVRPHWHRHLARAGQHASPGTPSTAVAAKGPAAPSAATVAALTVLPVAPPPLPKPMVPLPPLTTKPEKPKPPLVAASPTKPATPPATPAQAKPAPTVPAPAPALSPQLALPAATPPPLPPSLAPATRLAETTPGPAAAAPPVAAAPAAKPSGPAPDALPTGADRLTLPFFVQASDLPPAEQAMLRDFAQRFGPQAHYIIRAYASPATGDDDTSAPRRLSLQRAQSVQGALIDAGAAPGLIRLLAMGPAGGTPADRVEVIAMPAPAAPPSTPTP